VGLIAFRVKLDYAIFVLACDGDVLAYIYIYVHVSICIYLCNPAGRTLAGQWISKDRMKEQLGWSDRRIKQVEKACLREGLFKYDRYESDVILFGVVTDDRFMSELPGS
jgi:hypothetical protein